MTNMWFLCLLCSVSLFFTFEPFPWGNGMWWHLNELQRITRTIAIMPILIAIAISSMGGSKQ